MVYCWLLNLLVQIHSTTAIVQGQLKLYRQLKMLRTLQTAKKWKYGTKPRLPHSLEKVVPILVLQFENDPLFVAKHFSAQNDPFFAIKHWLFSPKWTPFFAVKRDFSVQMNTLCTVKHWTSNLTPFFSKFKELSTKIPLFSRKMRILDFLKKYRVIHEF